MSCFVHRVDTNPVFTSACLQLQRLRHVQSVSGLRVCAAESGRDEQGRVITAVQRGGHSLHITDLGQVGAQARGDSEEAGSIYSIK